MNGFLYRLSQTIKDTGEKFHSRTLIGLGLAIRELVLKIKNHKEKK